MHPRCVRKSSLLKGTIVDLDTQAQGVDALLKIPHSMAEEFKEKFSRSICIAADDKPVWRCHENWSGCTMTTYGFVQLAVENPRTGMHLILWTMVEICKPESDNTAPRLLLGDRSLHVKPWLNQDLLVKAGHRQPAVRLLNEDFGMITMGCWDVQTKLGPIFSHVAEIWDGRPANFNVTTCSVTLKKDKDGNYLTPKGSGHWWSRQRTEPLEIEALDGFHDDYGPHLKHDPDPYNRFAAHPVIVPKPNGRGMRVCFNFKPLNLVTEDEGLLLSRHEGTVHLTCAPFVARPQFASKRQSTI